MLTLPSALSNGKDAKDVKPVVLIDFDSLLYVSSKSISITSFSYQSLLNQGNSVSSGFKIPELINGFSSISFPSIKLTSWRATLRANLVGTTPDLTGMTVSVYEMLDAGGTQSKGDAVLIFSGKVSTWGVQGDIMTVKVKDVFNFSTIPLHTLKYYNINTLASDRVCRPIQVGDFNWTFDPRYYSQCPNSYAIAPLDSAPDNGQWTWFLCSHTMNAIPTAANLEDDIGNAYAFVVRDKRFVHVTFDTGAVIVSEFPAFTRIRATVPNHQCSVFGELTAEGSTNNMGTWANAIDGNSGTTVQLTNVGDILNVTGANFANLSENIPQNDGTPPAVELNPIIHVRYGSIVGIGAGFPAVISWRQNSGSSWSSGVPIPASDPPGNSWVTYQTDLALESWDDFAACEFKIEFVDAAHTLVTVVQMIVEMPVQDLSSGDRFLYIRCKGAEYSGTWGGRKTAGNLVDNLADVVEMILRDVEMGGYSITNIDTASFDRVNAALSGVEVCGSIYLQQEGDSALDDICHACGFSLIKSPTGRWRLVMPNPTNNIFASSGTGTPGSQDIFTDSPALSAGGDYSNHPIDKSSFELSRSSEGDVYGIVELNYRVTHQGAVKNTSVGSSGIIKTIENPLIADDTSAAAFLAVVDSWFQNQKMIAHFETYLNAIAHEVGDVINIRHDDLNDDILNATVNTQKFMIIQIGHQWRPNKIQITAIELL